MGSAHQLRWQPRPGQVGYLAAIGVGVGDDDTVDAVAEVECATVEEAMAWVERELLAARLPDWALQRPDGPAGVFLYGCVTRGHYTADDPPQWEPDGSGVAADGDLSAGRVRWRHHRWRHPLSST